MRRAGQRRAAAPAAGGRGADNGPGVPEHLRAHLFDPFVTTKRNGTGLGLALVAKMVADHGGVIEFDSRAAAHGLPGAAAGVPPAAVAQDGIR